MTDLFTTFASVVMPDLARQSIADEAATEDMEFPLQCDNTTPCPIPATWAYGCRTCTLGGFACQPHKDSAHNGRPVICKSCKTDGAIDEVFVWAPITIGKP